MQQDRFLFRLLKDRLFKIAVIIFSFCSILPLLFILFYIAKNGIAVINWQFLTQLPKPVGESGGGISNAIVGTLMLLVVACTLAVPLGISAGIYLSEHKEGRLSYLVRLCVEILHGIPSIVIDAAGNCPHRGGNPEAYPRNPERSIPGTGSALLQNNS
jgi:phosphate transport system permease protein